MVKRLSISGVLFVLMSCGAAQAATQAPVELPRVLIIATGGTIAGEQGEPGTLGGYDIRKPTGENVADAPESQKYARGNGHQFGNFPSDVVPANRRVHLARESQPLFAKRRED